MLFGKSVVPLFDTFWKKALLIGSIVDLAGNINWKCAVIKFGQPLILVSQVWKLVGNSQWSTVIFACVSQSSYSLHA